MEKKIYRVNIRADLFFKNEDGGIYHKFYNTNINTNSPQEIEMLLNDPKKGWNVLCKHFGLPKGNEIGGNMWITLSDTNKTKMLSLDGVFNKKP